MEDKIHPQYPCASSCQPAWDAPEKRILGPGGCLGEQEAVLLQMPGS